MLSAELLACADVCLRRVGTPGFGSEDCTATEGIAHARERSAKFAWVDRRVEFHCKHWKAFETKFIKHNVQRASSSSNMVVDEPSTGGVQAGTNTGKGKAPADTQVRAQSAFRPLDLQILYECACSTRNVLRTSHRKNHVRGIAQ